MPQITRLPGCPLPGTLMTVDRRELLRLGAVAAIGAGLPPETARQPAVRQPATVGPGTGRLKQSVCRWAFQALPLPDLCRAGAAMGLAGIDLPQGDHTAFGAAVIEAVGSPRVKLLYDIYHMQIMEGDIIRTIRTHAAHIGHFHTGGVPGRHELDDTQELNWRAVATAIADLGFQGFVAHEFVPTHDPLASLKQAVAVCTV